MTQQEQTKLERMVQAAFYTYYAVIGVVVVATVAGITINALDMIAICIGAGIAYPFIYWMTRGTK